MKRRLVRKKNAARKGGRLLGVFLGDSDDRDAYKRRQEGVQCARLRRSPVAEK